MPAPTVRSIAAAAGVSHETVARALRNDPRVASATRERILLLAQQVGYHANPLVRALMRSRSAGSAREVTANVAFLKPIRERGDYWGKSPFREQVEGCLTRLRELGFTASPLEIPESEILRPGLMRIIRARGIHGLVIGSMPQGHRRLNVCPEELAMVGCGLALRYPIVSRVSSDFAGNLRMAMAEVVARGYCRPGLVIRRDQDERRDHLPTSVWEHIQKHEWKSGQRIPVFQGKKGDQVGLGKWLDRYHPDVILGMEYDFHIKILRTRQSEQGEVVDYLHLEAPESPDDISGVRSNNFDVGALSAEFLAQLLINNEYGLPTRRLTTLLQPVWREGSTLRPREADALDVTLPGCKSS